MFVPVSGVSVLGYVQVVKCVSVCVSVKFVNSVWVSVSVKFVKRVNVSVKFARQTSAMSRLGRSPVCLLNPPKPLDRTALCRALFYVSMQRAAQFSVLLYNAWNYCTLQCCAKYIIVKFSVQCFKCPCAVQSIALMYKLVYRALHCCTVHPMWSKVLWSELLFNKVMCIKVLCSKVFWSELLFS